MKKHIAVALLLILAGTGCFSQDMLKQMRSNVRETIDGKEYFIHTVKRGQTLYMISKAYGVEVNDVIRENPAVREGITSDMKLRIPVPPGQQASPKPTGKGTGAKPDPVVVPPPADAMPAPEPTPPAPVPCGQDASTRQNSYTVVLMLPLFLNDVVAMDAVNPPDDPETEYQPLKFVQFYEGFLFALDSVSKLGMKVKVLVVDVDRDTVKTRQLLNDAEFKKVDLIIGFLYPSNFRIVADFARKNGINIINPLSERDEVLQGNPRVFKVRAGSSSLVANLADLLRHDFPEARIVVVSPPSYDKMLADQIRSRCLEAGFDIEVTESAVTASAKLSPDRENVIILLAETKSSALDMITKLHEKRTDFKLTVIGLPRWDKLDDLEADYLVNLKTHVFSPGFVDFTKEGPRKFAVKYQEKYGAIPDQLALEGFDVGFYFLTALFNFGKNFERCISDYSIPSLQTHYRFSQNGERGFENQDWSVYRYENYRMVSVDR